MRWIKGIGTNHNVSVPIEKLDELLEAPKAALQTAHQKFRTSVLSSCAHTHTKRKLSYGLYRDETPTDSSNRAHEMAMVKIRDASLLSKRCILKPVIINWHNMSIVQR